MKNKLIYLLIAFILPYTYNHVMELGNVIFLEIAYLTGWNLEYFLVDTILCIFLAMIYHLWYIKIRNRPYKIETKRISKYIPNWAVYLIITFGLAGISNVWFEIANFLSSGSEVISNSIQSFDDTWANIGDETYIWVFLSVAVVGPFVEEVLFRGLIYNYLDKVKGGYFAVIVSSISFGLWHGEFVQVVYTMAIGVAIAIIYKYTNSLSLVFVIHFINNFTSTLPSVLDTNLTETILYNLNMIFLLPCIYFLFKIVEIMKEDKSENKNGDFHNL